MATESRPAIYASIAANVCIAITKLVVGSIAHSTAMLPEGVHSLTKPLGDPRWSYLPRHDAVGSG